MNDLGLPPHRELPPGVRDRMYASVREGMAERPRRSLRTPLGIAAAVAVLAGTAAVAGGVLDRDEPGRVPSAAGNTATLDRCWAAIEDSGKAADFPARQDWRQVSSTSLPASTVTGVRAGDTTLFCETTLTSVAVSAPLTATAPPDDELVHGVMLSPNGTVIGLAASGFDSVTVMTKDQVTTGLTDRPAWLGSADFAVRDGVFVGSWALHDLTGFPVEAVLYRENEEGESAPLSLPEPAVLRVDRPAEPGDRSSEAGRMLTECLAGPDTWGGAVVDAATWRPGAMLRQDFPSREVEKKETKPYRTAFVVATNERASAVCTTEPRWDFRIHPAPDTLTSARQPIALLAGENHRPGLTVAGVTGPDVSSIELEAGGEKVAARVSARTFTAYVPGVEEGGTGIGEGSVTATVRDDGGAVLYEGPLPPIAK
ncbi:hypothetical protein B0I33_111137 [Prauserella shujinwangii]|uniref:Uncharacterized protein n=1 Tax=Prauserella shujinwangii TaxID=1453103 RepID=A0A2T0LN61_9PSEU|nr:hypothetical protein [Prauserella shujinwangii]PRX44625.1 hypothetical protein B0I33_111137 [Prauserella shujinwangii]